VCEVPRFDADVWGWFDAVRTKKPVFQFSLASMVTHTWGQPLIRSPGISWHFCRGLQPVHPGLCTYNLDHSFSSVVLLMAALVFPPGFPPRILRTFSMPRRKPQSSRIFKSATSQHTAAYVPDARYLFP
jgi:hypothetical protein